MKSKAETLPLLLTASQAAALLGLHKSSVYALLKAGKLRAVRPLNQLRFVREEIEAFVREMPAAGAK